MLNTRSIVVVLLVSGFMATTAIRIAKAAAEPRQGLRTQAAPHTSALQAILHLGRTAQQPVGIILGDDSLCRWVNVSATNDGFPSLIDRILTQVRGYKWSLRDGVAIVEPNLVSHSTARLLALPIPRYSAPPSTLVEHEAFLNMNIRAVLRPNGAESGDILSSPEEAKTGPIELRDLTVEQIVNYLVKQEKGGAWILSPVPRDYRSATRRNFVQLASYADPTGRIERMYCNP